MDSRALVLIALVIISALSVVGLRHQSRLAFSELQSLRSDGDMLNIEWGRLLLEQGAWSQHQRVERIARTQLGMRTPENKRVIIVSVGDLSDIDHGAAR